MANVGDQRYKTRRTYGDNIASDNDKEADDDDDAGVAV